MREGRERRSLRERTGVREGRRERAGRGAAALLLGGR
jgi:hypothetical protein